MDKECKVLSFVEDVLHKSRHEVITNDFAESHRKQNFTEWIILCGGSDFFGVEIKLT